LITRRSVERGGQLLLTLPLVYASAVLWLVPRWTVDDAYITFRYAEHLANFGQLVWNIGERPVEGYTGGTLPLLVAGLMKLGVAAPIGRRTLGITFFFLGGLLVYLLMRRLGIGLSVRSVVLWLYFGAPMMFTHALSGLETLLFTTMLVACLYALVACLERS